MNIFTIIGVVVVVILVAGYFGVHSLSFWSGESRLKGRSRSTQPSGQALAKGRLGRRGQSSTGSANGRARTDGGGSPDCAGADRPSTGV